MSLWNIYDDVLRLIKINGVSTGALADDLVVLVEADESLYQIERWVVRQGLELVLLKTEAVILKGPRKREVKISIAGTPIAQTRQLNYLEVILNDNISFGLQVQEAKN